MGAWGIGVFENDSALDWVGELISSNGCSLLFSTLNKMKQAAKFSVLSRLFKRYNEIYVVEPDGSEILAAAEVVTCLKGRFNNDLPEELATWIENNKSDEIFKLVDLARSAVKKVKEKSEIKELWQESDEFDEWLTVVQGLEDRL